MYWLDLLHALQLDDDCFSDQQVDSVATVQLHLFVLYGELDLPAKGNAPKAKLMAQTLLIGGLEKAGAQGAVNLDCGAYDLLRQLLVKELALSSLCLVLHLIFRQHDFLRASASPR